MLKKLRVVLFTLLGAGGALVLSGAAAQAQNYPTRPITIIVPNVAGNPLDLTPRFLAVEMAKTLGQPVVVENKPGAATLLGMEYVATSAPADGYTLLIATDNNMALFPITVKNLRFDPLKDLVPFMATSSSKLMLASASKSADKTVEQLVAHAKASPGKLNYGSGSATNQLQMEALLRKFGINVERISYNNTAIHNQALVTDEIQMAWLTEAAAVSLGEQVRILGQTGDKRSVRYPDAPTFTELGLPQIGGFTLIMSVRAGTPKPIIDRLYAAAAQALNSGDMKEQIAAKLQMEVNAPERQNPDAAYKHVADLTKFYRDVAQQIGFKPEE